MSEIGEKEVKKSQEDHLKRLQDMKTNLSFMTRDWDRLENKGIKHFPILANRFLVGYKSNLNFDELVVNKPPHKLPAASWPVRENDESQAQLSQVLSESENGDSRLRSGRPQNQRFANSALFPTNHQERPSSNFFRVKPSPQIPEAQRILQKYKKHTEERIKEFESFKV